MGLIDKIFGKKQPDLLKEYFQTLSAYTPVFTNFSGGLYEMDLTRAAIHTFAKHAAKLKPEIKGKAYRNLQNTLAYKPNEWMDTYKYIYRIATILKVDGTCFVVPLYRDQTETEIIGFYPLNSSSVELMDYQGNMWLRYTFANGRRAVIEYSRVGVMIDHQYKNEFLGENNLNVMVPTMQLLDTQRQGIEDGIRQSAAIRFMARIGQVLRPEDIENERAQFTKTNLSSDNKTGVMMFDSKYAEVKQIESKPLLIDADQTRQIKENVYTYFGCNENILQNKYTEDEWNAYYEGEIESFAVQLSLVHTNMLFTPRELTNNNAVVFSSNRLQYASNSTKMNIVMQGIDRGLLTLNESREIFNLPPVEGGDVRYIRRDYANVDEIGKIEEEENG